MKILSVLLLLLTPVLSLAQSRPEWACLRITSHGCSGTVIQAEEGKSLVLSCAHMFLAPPRYEGEPDRIDPNMLARSFTFDAPHPNPASDPRPGIRLLKYDIALDLCLIQVNTKLPYVCPVCREPVAAASVVASAGYDAMRWPVLVRPAHLKNVAGYRQFTHERPQAGRSGGPLLARCGSGTCVVGVCTGYTGTPNGQEVLAGESGIYSSQSAISHFLGINPQAGPPVAVPGVPVVPAAPAAPRAPIVQLPGTPGGRQLLPHEVNGGGRPLRPHELYDPRALSAPQAPGVVDRLLPCPGGT